MKVVSRANHVNPASRAVIVVRALSVSHVSVARKPLLRSWQPKVLHRKQKPRQKVGSVVRVAAVIRATVASVRRVIAISKCW